MDGEQQLEKYSFTCVYLWFCDHDKDFLWGYCADNCGIVHMEIYIGNKKQKKDMAVIDGEICSVWNDSTSAGTALQCT